VSALATRRGRGYAMVAASYAIMGLIGALVAWAEAPESMLVVLRMAIAAAVLAVFYARRPLWEEIRRPGMLRLLLLMAALDSATLLLFFMSMRLAGVAVGMFLIFLSPLWVALLAPVVLRQPTDRMVWPGLVIAMGGLAFIVVPAAVGEDLLFSPWGVVCGLASGVLLAGFMMSVSALRARGLRSTTIVIAEGVLDALFLLPLAVWQTWVVGDGLTRVDLVSALILGTVCTAFAYTLWTEGVGFVPVQHVPILGYLEPLAAPVYAFLLVGEVPSLWTVIGGLFIVAAGALVILKGEQAEGPPGPPVTEAAPAGETPTAGPRSAEDALNTGPQAGPGRLLD